MATKNSILLGTLGKYSDRFHTYQPEKSFSERLEVAKSIPRTDGVEPVYPQDLGHNGENVQILKDSGHKVCLLYTSPSPRDGLLSRMPSSA